MSFLTEKEYISFLFFSYIWGLLFEGTKGRNYLILSVKPLSLGASLYIRIAVLDTFSLEDKGSILKDIVQTRLWRMF